MSLKIDIIVDTSSITKLTTKMSAAADPARRAAAMHELGLLMERNIVARTPRRTGGAAGSVLLKSWSSTQAMVTGALSYWPPLEEGSRAHIIAPKNAKVLAFRTKSGTKVFARRVKHPGTKGVHAFRDGAKDTAPKVAPIIMKHLGLS